MEVQNECNQELYLMNDVPRDEVVGGSHINEHHNLLPINFSLKTKGSN